MFVKYKRNLKSFHYYKQDLKKNPFPSRCRVLSSPLARKPLAAPLASRRDRATATSARRGTDGRRILEPCGNNLQRLEGHRREGWRRRSSTERLTSHRLLIPAIHGYFFHIFCASFIKFRSTSLKLRAVYAHQGQINGWVVNIKWF
jgi:hypothetical protein